MIERFLNFLDSRLAFRLVQLGVVISIIFGLGLTYNQYQYTHCLARYNEANAKATQQRSEAADADRRALDDLINAIVQSGQARTQEEGRGMTRAAFIQYLKNRNETNQRRKDNPVAAPPSESC